MADFAVANRGNPIQDALATILQNRQRQSQARLQAIQQQATAEGQQRRSRASALTGALGNQNVAAALSASPQAGQALQGAQTGLGVAQVATSLVGPGREIRIAEETMRAEDLAMFKSNIVERRAIRGEQRQRDRGLTAGKEIEGKILEQIAAKGAASLTRNQLDFMTTIRTQRQTTPGIISAKAKEAAAINVQKLTSSLASFATTLQAAKELGDGVAGYRAAVSQFLGGRLSQIDAGLGNAATQAISGTSVEELQDFRLRAQNMVANTIELFTGEESGRISESERALTQKAVALTTPSASFGQIKRGLETIMVFAMVKLDQQARIAGKPLDFDLRTDIGKDKFSVMAGQLGMSPDSAREAYIEIKLSRALLREQGIGLQ